MLLSSLPVDAANNTASSLRNVIEQKSESLQWLVVADDQPQLLSRLRSGLVDEQTAIVTAPQSSWDLGGQEFIAGLEELLSGQQPSHLLLAGDSLADFETVAESDAAIDGAGQSEAAASNRIFNGARKVQLRIKQAKRHLIQQVTRLCQHDGVREALESGKLTLHVLFLHVETNEFFRFDFGDGEFRRVGLETSRAG